MNLVSPVAPTRLANPPRGTRELGGGREGGTEGGGREDRGSHPTVILFPIMVDAPSNI